MEKEKNNINFVLDTNESLANAIRRSVNQIPCLAVEDVEIIKNDSALYDEILAHRIGLIPLKEKRKLNERGKCVCKGKGCTKCQIQLVLKAKNKREVYSGDFSGEAEVVYDKMPIVLMEEGQEIELTAFAQLGEGAKHAKFSPGLLYYRKIAEIKINDVEEGQKVINLLKDSLINAPKGNVKKGEVYQSKKDADYIETLIEDKGSVEVSEGKEIVFFIESWGQKAPKEIFSEAVKSLNSNLKEVLKVVK